MHDKNIIFLLTKDEYRKKIKKDQGRSRLGYVHIFDHLLRRGH